MAELFDHIDELRRSRRRAVMATLVNTRGTTPRKEGAQMLVGEGGAVLGSVTIGGCVDAQVIEESEDVLNSGRPRLLEMNLGDEEAWEIGLTCGGTIEVFVEPLATELLDRVRAHAAAGRSGAILTGLGGGARAFVEVVAPAALLLVVGAGHVAMPLTQLARGLGYRTVVVGGRPRFATRERFPDVDELKVGIPSQLIGDYPLVPSTALVLVAHDYKYDLPVLERALATEVGYIGMLGSARRGAALLARRTGEGVPDAALKRIRVPIGLDLGARSAPEIALAILAEIQAVRGGGSGLPMSARPRRDPA